MNGRRAIVGLCMLCALLVSAFAAQSASAVTKVKGTTAFTCKPVTPVDNTVGFSKAHCRPEDAVSTKATFEHFEIPPNTTTKITGNNKTTGGESEATKLVSTAFGATIELSGKVTEGEGWMTNAVEGKEHYTHGEGTITYKEVSVVKPANCIVQTDGPLKEKGEAGVIHTEPLKATTKGQGDRLKFEPKEGTVFARFWIEGATCPLKENTFSVSGTVLGTPNGATTNFTEADTTAQNTLKLGANKAGLSGTLTLEGKHPGDKEKGKEEDKTYEPLSVTTVETEEP
jgi:hypothetical protein